SPLPNPSGGRGPYSFLVAETYLLSERVSRRDTCPSASISIHVLNARLSLSGRSSGQISAGGHGGNEGEWRPILIEPIHKSRCRNASTLSDIYRTSTQGRSCKAGQLHGA